MAAIPLLGQAVAFFVIFPRQIRVYDSLKPDPPDDKHSLKPDPPDDKPGPQSLLCHPYLDESKDHLPLYDLLVNEGMKEALEHICKRKERLKLVEQEALEKVEKEAMDITPLHELRGRIDRQEEDVRGKPSIQNLLVS
jgi:hypothetical protein